ncbi:clustered mitochondria protein [Carica papaya]|uniref:clustered mitochondria protein n=1 Tax=Carica papaya TaxID=3649 RepID=UPI000B8C8C5C|nr:clustered mitochondria protein [Carica papaya]
MNAQKQKGQALNAASAQKAIDILKAHPDLIHAFQAAAAAGGSGSSNANVSKSINAAIVGESVPRGRGFDERAARAAAEVRKKAAARGLLVRPHGVPETDGAKKENNGEASDGPTADAKQKQPISGQADQAPVGLGAGLTSLDAKKQKAKAKVGA